MGLGLVLAGWAVIGTLFAIAAGAALAGICFLILRSRRLVNRRWILAFAVAPFLCGTYCFVAFIGYGLWCETKPGVDFGIGDSFRVQLGNHYEFQAIDTPEHPFLVAPDGTQFHDELQRIGVTSNWIYGEVSPTAFFLIDATNKSETSFQIPATFPTLCTNAVWLTSNCFHQNDSTVSIVSDLLT